MHYRIRGNSVQIVRSISDPETGRAKSEPVGSANLRTGKLNENAIQNLSEDEVREVEGWIKEEAELRDLGLMLEIRRLPQTLGNIVAFLKGEERDISDQLRENIRLSLSDTRRALRKEASTAIKAKPASRKAAVES